MSPTDLPSLKIPCNSKQFLLFGLINNWVDKNAMNVWLRHILIKV